MSQSPDGRERRPPPATGRQDRHARPAPPEPPLPEMEEEAVERGPLGPRGHAFYAQGRSRSYGFGCLVAATVAALGAMVLMIGLAFVPADDGIVVGPVGGPVGGPGDGQTPAAPGDPAPAGD